MSVVRAVDGQETGLSVQPAEKKTDFRPARNFIYRSWSHVFTDQSRSLSRDSPNKKVGSTFFALTSTVIPVF